MGLAVIGLGRGFMLTLPSILADARLKLVAACDPRPEARSAFEKQFNGYSTTHPDDLLAQKEVEVVYVASPHQFHKEHAVKALEAGKHVLIEKPIAIDLADSRQIVDAAKKSQCHVTVGPCHSFDPQIQASLDLIRSGRYGRLRMINASYYTDFMYRPRRKEELNTEDGGGVVFSQGAHQIDIVRLLAGGMVHKIAAYTGIWDKSRASEGAYSALLQFQNGVCANLTYSGYAHFDSDENSDWISEIGTRKDPGQYGQTRRNLKGISQDFTETDLKEKRTFGQSGLPPESSENEHFGDLLLSLDHADVKVMPGALKIYGDDTLETMPVNCENGSRAGAMDAIWHMARENRSAIQDARWGHATLEACHGILQAAKSGSWREMSEQVAVADYPVTTKEQTGSRS